MRTRVVPFLTILAALAALASCIDDPVTDRTPVVGLEPDTTTPRDNQEAEEAALWLSGELVAPQDLYDAIHSDLAAIRAGYLDSIPKVAIEFRPPWVISQVVVTLTNEARDRFLAREPNDVDSLNGVFHATHLDTLRLKGSPPHTTLIDFPGRQNSKVLAAFYDAQDDVVWGETNSWIGDWSNVYPWKHHGNMTYLFRYGIGDCPAGCISNTFWYFRRVGGVTEYVGSFEWGVDRKPDWWNEAKEAFYTFRGFPVTRLSR